MSNYQNRRKRGQCAGCTNQAMPDAVRERAFQRSLERERRLDEIDTRLKQEIAELEKALAS